MQQESIRVWDIPVRLTHWLITLLFVVSWVTAENGWMEWHERSGLAILVLVLARIAWGFVGSTPARFGYFLRPAAAPAFARGLLRGESHYYLSHNPLGGLMVIALLLALLVQVTLGLFSNDDLFFEGPLAWRISDDLSGTLSSWHHFNFSILLTLAGIHVAAVLYHRLRLKHNLVVPMVTGNKPAAGTDTGHFRFTSPYAWLCLVVVFAGIVGMTIGYR